VPVAGYEDPILSINDLTYEDALKARSEAQAQALEGGLAKKDDLDAEPVATPYVPPPPDPEADPLVLTPGYVSVYNPTPYAVEVIENGGTMYHVRAHGIDHATPQAVQDSVKTVLGKMGVWELETPAEGATPEAIEACRQKNAESMKAADKAWLVYAASTAAKRSGF
jgi:hypothetical protein